MGDRDDEHYILCTKYNTEKKSITTRNDSILNDKYNNIGFLNLVYGFLFHSIEILKRLLLLICSCDGRENRQRNAINSLPSPITQYSPAPKKKLVFIFKFFFLYFIDLT